VAEGEGDNMVYIIVKKVIKPTISPIPNIVPRQNAVIGSSITKSINA